MKIVKKSLRKANQILKQWAKNPDAGMSLLEVVSPGEVNRNEPSTAVSWKVDSATGEMYEVRQLIPPSIAHSDEGASLHWWGLEFKWLTQNWFKQFETYDELWTLRHLLTAMLIAVGVDLAAGCSASLIATAVSAGAAAPVAAGTCVSAALVAGLAYLSERLMDELKDEFDECHKSAEAVAPDFSNWQFVRIVAPYASPLITTRCNLVPVP